MLQMAVQKNAQSDESPGKNSEYYNQYVEMQQQAPQNEY